jgi:methionine-rich copper-binding protein CopC
MTIIDKTAPKLVSALPKKGVTAVPVSQDIVLTFNEAIKLGTGNVTLSSSKGDIQTLSVATSSGVTDQFSINGKVITINPTKDLLPNSRYSIKIDNTAILDLSDNKYAGIKNTTTLYFDTVDTLAPTLIKTSPVINTSNVASNASMVLTLSEKIQAGTGSITLVSGYDSRTISLTDKQVKISGTTLTINPNVDFNVGSTYAVHLDAGAIKDLAPVSNSAVAIDFSLTTKATGDKQAPVLQSYLGKGAASTNLQLTFQESIKIGKGSFTLVNSADSKDKISISATDTTQVSIANNVLTINPKENLKPETTYLLTAPKGIVTDLVKNAFAGIAAKVPFKFDTHDTTAPELKISGEKATAINSPIVYTFEASEAIKDFTADDIVVTGGTKGEFKAVTGTNNFTLSVTPEVNSTKPMTVDVVAGKFTDVIGNTNVATSQNTQAVDTVLPTLIISGEKATTTNSAVIYTFTPSEAITGFTVDDITVTGGTKGEFKAVTGTNNFTLSVTPEVNSTKPITVDRGSR